MRGATGGRSSSKTMAAMTVDNTWTDDYAPYRGSQGRAIDPFFVPCEPGPSCDPDSHKAASETVPASQGARSLVQ